MRQAKKKKKNENELEYVMQTFTQNKLAKKMMPYYLFQTILCQRESNLGQKSLNINRMSRKSFEYTKEMISKKTLHYQYNKMQCFYTHNGDDVDEGDKKNPS